MERITTDSLSWKPGGSYVLRTITSEFRAGVFYGIVGPNGSGKTSLLRHILRGLEPMPGAVRLDGADIRGMRRRAWARVISWVPQNTALDVGFAAYDIVMMGRTAYIKPLRTEGEADRAAVREAMEMTNCWELRDAAFNTLSGGEAQRVATARAIAQDTPVIVLDEPVSHLDIRHQRELMETMRELNTKRGKTVLAVLHDLNLAAQYCCELILLHNGQIYDRGAPEDVLSADNLLAVYGLEFYRLKHPGTEGLYLIPR
jgi:iron complex transport system ATP-binding protein